MCSSQETLQVQSIGTLPKISAMESFRQRSRWNGEYTKTSIFSFRVSTQAYILAHVYLLNYLLAYLLCLSFCWPVYLFVTQSLCLLTLSSWYSFLQSFLHWKIITYLTSTSILVVNNWLDYLYMHCHFCLGSEYLCTLSRISVTFWHFCRD